MLGPEEGGSRADYADKSFMHLGLDSLSMMEMRNRLNALYRKYLAASQGVSTTAAATALASPHQLSPTLLFDFPTPNLLVTEFNHQLHIHLHAGIVQSSSDSPVSSSRQTPATASLSSPPPLTQQLSASSTSSSSSSVASAFAVLGMSCRFPGGCHAPDLFHRKLCDGLDAITVIPTEWHWNARTKHVSILNDSDAEKFDPGYFQLNLKEAELMDPHQRLVLELCHEALIDARILGDDKSKGKGCLIDTMTNGVFVGLCNNDWLASPSALNDVGPYSSTGTAMSTTANRVSFLLGLTGPSMVIDTGQPLLNADRYTAIPRT
jgi:polyketide synthase 13